MIKHFFQFLRRTKHKPVPKAMPVIKPIKTAYWCNWPWNTLVVLCDGNVVCGCADPRAERPVGNLREESLAEVWQGILMNHIRQGLLEGYTPFCQDCGLKTLLHDTAWPPEQPVVPPGPTRLFVEPTICCNINCYNSHCNKSSGITRTRRNKLMSFDFFRSIVDQAAPTLQRLELFNYGEPFLNKKLPEMIAYVRQHYPHVFTFTSTNGLVWNNEDQIRRVIESGLHELVFSIDGASPEIYTKYRQGGDFKRVIRNVKTMVRLRNAMARVYPIITYRMILFHWNDSDEEMNKTRSLARDIGVDRLCWELTDHPEGCPSLRFRPGTKDYETIRCECWDNGALANALPEKSLRATISADTDALAVKNGERVDLKITVCNSGHDLWFATSPDNLRFVTMGIQLLDQQNTCLDRDFFRALLPNNVHPGQSMTLPVQFKAPLPGKYRLKCDLVMEGYGWFESGGSPTYSIDLTVPEQD